MPGVLIVEAMAQAGGVLLFTEVEDRESKLVLFTGIERAKFRRPVVPGDQLRIEVDVKVWRGNAGRMQGTAYVGDTARRRSPCNLQAGRSGARRKDASAMIDRNLLARVGGR